MFKNSQKDVFVSVVLPMFNEESGVQENLKALLAVLKKMPCRWELLLVDDGSMDASVKEAKKALDNVQEARVISYSPNRGRGFALRCGFEAAKGDYVITTESDLSWGADVVYQIYQKLIGSGADVVIVSPYLKPKGLVGVPLQRRLLSRLGNKVLTFGLPVKLTMVTGMTRGYKRAMLENIILQMDGKEIHLEIISKLIGLGAKFEEIPGVITWHEKQERTKRKKESKIKRLILSHLYFSVVESPIHFIGLLGLFFMGMGFVGIMAIAIMKFYGFSLLRLPFFPHYVIGSFIIGLIIFIFSLLSSQITKLERELMRVYAKIVSSTKTKTD